MPVAPAHVLLPKSCSARREQLGTLNLHDLGHARARLSPLGAKIKVSVGQ